MPANEAQGPNDLSPGLPLRSFPSAGPLRHPDARHQSQDYSLPASDTLGVYLRIEYGAWIGNHRGKKSGFARIEVSSGLVKIVLRGGFGAINPIPPFNDVQVEFQDAMLRKTALHEVSNDRFLAFARECALRSWRWWPDSDRGAQIRAAALPLRKRFRQALPRQLHKSCI